MDRKNRSHGGVIIYIRNDIAIEAELLLGYSDSQVEFVAVKIKSINLVVINCYRPPQCDLDKFEKAMTELNKMIDKLPTPTPSVIMCGDFNFPHVQWPGGTISGGTKEEHKQVKLLFNATDRVFLQQLITKPTRINNVLDLFFINNEAAISSYKVEKTIFSDHSLVNILTTYRKDHHTEITVCAKVSPFAAFNYFSTKIDWEEIQASFTKVIWEKVLDGLDPDTMLQFIIDKLLETSEAHVPKKTKRRKNLHCSIPRDRKILMRKRASFNAQLKQITSDERRCTIMAKVRNVEEKLSHIITKEYLKKIKQS